MYLSLTGSEQLTVGTVLNILKAAARRCELSGKAVSEDRKLADCLHLILFNGVPTLRLSLGLTCHLALGQFAAVDRDSEGRVRRSGSPDEAPLWKKEAQKDSKGPLNEARASDPLYAGAFLDPLKKPAAGQSNGFLAARLLWLPPSVLSEESIELLRCFLESPCRSPCGNKEGGIMAACRATVSSRTTRGHFTLPLDDAKYNKYYRAGEAKNEAKPSIQDLAILIAIFSGAKVNTVPCLFPRLAASSSCTLQSKSKFRSEILRAFWGLG